MKESCWVIIYKYIEFIHSITTSKGKLGFTQFSHSANV